MSVGIHIGILDIKGALTYVGQWCTCMARTFLKTQAVNCRRTAGELKGVVRSSPIRQQSGQRHSRKIRYIYGIICAKLQLFYF